MMDERIITRDTIERYSEKLLACLELDVAGMSANDTFGSYRMGPIFGGALLSGKKVADIVADKIK
jgi:ribulose 1,5-bisphosphate synthetase/thiazole synthase